MISAQPTRFASYLSLYSMASAAAYHLTLLAFFMHHAGFAAT